MSWIKNNIDPKLVEYLFVIRIENIPNFGGYQRDTTDDLAINFEMLETQLQETPQMIAFWNALLAEQKIKVETLERRIKTVRGLVTKTLLKESQDNKVEMRSTELREIINADRKVLELDSELLRQKRVEERLKNIVENLIRKFDALRSLSGFKKDEKRTQ